MNEAAPVSRTTARFGWAMALAVVAALGPSPAAAEPPLANVTGFSVGNVSVRSLGCKDVPVTMGVAQADDVSGTDVTTHIYRGTREIDYWFFENNQPDTWLWCPHLDG